MSLLKLKSLLYKALGGLATLIVAWCTLGLLVTWLAPSWQDRLEAEISHSIQLETRGERLEGFFDLIHIGVRLIKPEFHDDQGEFLQAEELEIELSPLKNLFQNIWSIFKISLIEPHFHLNQLSQDAWQAQGRYSLYFSPEQEESPTMRAPVPTQESEDAPSPRISQIEETLQLLLPLANNINILGAKVDLFFINPERKRTLSEIDFVFIGGEEPSAIIHNISDQNYSEKIFLEIFVNRPTDTYARFNYDLRVENFNYSLFEDIFPRLMQDQVGDINLQAKGWWSRLNQYHSVDFQLDKFTTVTEQIEISHSLAGQLQLAYSDKQLDIEIPKFDYVAKSGQRSQQVSFEELQYYDQRSEFGVEKFYFRLKEATIAREAYSALVDLKKHFLPDLYRSFDETIVDGQIDQLQFVVDLKNKNLIRATGDAKFNFAQIEQGTFFSNVKVHIDDDKGEFLYGVSARGMDLAIANILAPIQIHSVDNLVVRVGVLPDSWRLRGATEEVAIIPGKSLSLDLSLEFKPEYSPYIFLRFAGKDIPEDILQPRLPRLLLNSKLDEWLWQSVGSGVVEEGYVEYGGNVFLAQAPIYPETFTLRLKLIEATLEFNPEWPALAEVEGLIEIQNSVLTGQLVGLYQQTAVDAKIRIPSFTDPQIFVAATTEGNFVDAKSFLLNSPIRDNVNGFFTNAVSDDLVRTTNEIVVDADGVRDTQYRGKVALDQVNLDLPDVGLHFEAIVGEVAYSEKGVHGENIAALYSGQPARLNIHTPIVLATPHIGVEIKVRLKPQEVILAESVMRALAVEGDSLWTFQYLVPMREYPLTPSRARPDSEPIPQAKWSEFILPMLPDGSLACANSQGLLRAYSDLHGVSIADHISIHKTKEQTMPVAIAAHLAPDNRWRVRAGIDQDLRARILLEYDADGAHPLQARIDLTQGIAKEQTEAAKQNPEEYLVTDLLHPTNHLAAPSSGVSSAVVDALDAPLQKGAENFSSWQNMGIFTAPMWGAMCQDTFFAGLTEGWLKISGELKQLTVEPWTTTLLGSDAEESQHQEQESQLANGAESAGNSRSGLAQDIRLDLGRVDIFGLQFAQTNMQLVYADSDLKIAMSGADLEGNIDLNFEQEGRLNVVINRLYHRSEVSKAQVVKQGNAAKSELTSSATAGGTPLGETDKVGSELSHTPRSESLADGRGGCHSYRTRPRRKLHATVASRRAKYGCSAGRHHSS